MPIGNAGDLSKGLFKTNSHQPSFNPAIDFPECNINFNKSFVSAISMNFTSSILK